MLEILKSQGVSVRSVKLIEVDTISKAIGSHSVNGSVRYAVASSWTEPDYWRPESDNDIAVLIEK